MKDKPASFIFISTSLFFAHHRTLRLGAWNLNHRRSASNSSRPSLVRPCNARNKSKLTLYPISGGVLARRRSSAAAIVAVCIAREKEEGVAAAVRGQLSMELELNFEIYRVNNRALIYDF